MIFKLEAEDSLTDGGGVSNEQAQALINIFDGDISWTEIQKK